MAENNDRLTAAMNLIAAHKKVTGRECGDCSMCCKLTRIDVPELKKPVDTWCRHCRPGKGCGIYEARPDVCKGFACLWLVNPDFGDEWKPSRAKIVIDLCRDGEQTVCAFIIDPGCPNRWREAPYYDTIKQIAFNGLRQTGPAHFVTQIKLGPRTFVVLPHKEVEVSNQPHIVIETGIRRQPWEVLRFESPDKAQACVDMMNAITEKNAAMPLGERAQFAAEAQVMLRELNMTERPS